MKFEVCKENNEKIVKFSLGEFNGNIILQAVNSNNERLMRGCIVTISKSGELSLHNNISENLGLKLDDYGRIKLEE